MTIRWLNRAVDDLQRTFNYLQEHAPHALPLILPAIYEAVSSLAETPYLGRPTSKLGVRQLLLNDIHYVVTYRVTLNSVDILRVRHGARRPLR